MIVNAIWFAGRSCIGIVQIVQDHEKEAYRQTGEANFKYYIGLGGGRDERTDMEGIAEWGSPFDKDAGDKLFRVT